MKKKICLIVFAIQALQFGFSQFVMRDRITLKKNEGFLHRREVLNEIIPENEISVNNFIHVEDFFSIDSNTMVLECLKNGQFSDFFLCVVEKDNDDYKTSRFDMNRAYLRGTKDFIKINNKIHPFRYENKNNQILFYADELGENKIKENKIPFHSQAYDKSDFFFEIQFFNQADKLYAIFCSIENKEEKINILTFSNTNLQLLSKQQINSGKILRFDAINNDENFNLYIENLDGSKRTASLYKIDQDGNYSQTGDKISLEGVTERAYFYKNKGQLFLCRYAVNLDESWTNTIFETGNSFKVLDEKIIPVETIYKSYYEKSFKEVKTRLFHLFNYGFHEVLKDDKQNTYILEYRIIRGEYPFYGVCDIFLTKINSNNVLEFSIPIKRSQRGAGQDELFPTVTITDEEITFEDFESDKRFQNGVYQENYDWNTLGLLKKNFLKTKVSISQENGEITRTVVN